MFVPTRIVERPARTVGLGDTISASAWLAEGD
ncbi:MAG TPA: ADP-dependent glucokinase/phosphofructokinase [Candidatus Latescibacteria bacterium]|nr:ADP-dependent glucokinase/phosphofructokinase [Candidatus Latescibacterota bacterium]